MQAYNPKTPLASLLAQMIKSLPVAIAASFAT
jgi:hypothetical protein